MKGNTKHSYILRQNYRPLNNYISSLEHRTKQQSRLFAQSEYQLQPLRNETLPTFEAAL